MSTFYTCIYEQGILSGYIPDTTSFVYFSSTNFYGSRIFPNSWTGQLATDALSCILSVHICTERKNERSEANFISYLTINYRVVSNSVFIISRYTYICAVEVPRRTLMTIQGKKIRPF